MVRETPDITRSQTGLDGVSWNILGQVYVPKQETDDSFAWHATFPAGTFVPPHMHTKQEEYLLVLDGRIDLELDGEKQSAGSGDLVRLPRGIPHAFFNNSGKPVTALFWVAPTGRLPDLFRRIHNLADPAEVVRLSPQYDVVFPPLASSAG